MALTSIYERLVCVCVCVLAVGDEILKRTSSVGYTRSQYRDTARNDFKYSELVLSLPLYERCYCKPKTIFIFCINKSISSFFLMSRIRLISYRWPGKMNFSLSLFYLYIIVPLHSNYFFRKIYYRKYIVDDIDTLLKEKWNLFKLIAITFDACFFNNKKHQIKRLKLQEYILHIRRVQLFHANIFPETFFLWIIFRTV